MDTHLPQDEGLVLVRRFTDELRETQPLSEPL